MLRRLIATTLAGLLACCSAAALAAPDLKHADSLLRQGKAAETFKLLVADEAKYAGDEDFDYLLGLAALESGQPGRATLIFERVLAVNPQHAGGQIDIGRAYLAMGDRDAARRAFLSARELNPPVPARLVIEQHLAALDAAATSAPRRAEAYVLAGFGRDGNVNQATASTSVFLPVFGSDFTLDSAARGTADNYLHAGGGASFAYALDERNGVFGGVDLRLRDYKHQDGYSYLTHDWNLGLRRGDAGNMLRVAALLGEYRLESDRYRISRGLAGDWQRAINATDRVVLFGQYLQARYVSESLNSNDSNLGLIGAGWSRQLGDSRLRSINASAFAGREAERNNRADGDKRLLGATLGARGELLPAVDLYGALAVQHGRYGRDNPIYLSTRRDTQVDLTLGASWRLGPAWSLVPQVAWTRNDSNLSIYEYRRHDLSVSLRHDFR